MLLTICIKTESGRQAFKERSADMLPKLRSAFILFDGVRSVSSVLAATAGLGVTQAEIETLVDLGYLAPAAEGAASVSITSPARLTPSRSEAQHSVPPETSPASLPPLPVDAAPLSWPQERYKRAYPIAAQLTAGLGLRGFRLHMAVESAMNYEQLIVLAPKIRDAVGVGKSQLFEQALGS